MVATEFIFVANVAPVGANALLTVAIEFNAAFKEMTVVRSLVLVEEELQFAAYSAPPLDELSNASSNDIFHL